MNPETPKSAVMTTTRVMLWIVVAAVFLVQVGLRIHRDHLAGTPITNWVVAQGALWTLVLLFWSWAAWREWKRRRDAGKVI